MLFCVYCCWFQFLGVHRGEKFPYEGVINNPPLDRTVSTSASTSTWDTTYLETTYRYDHLCALPRVANVDLNDNNFLACQLSIVTNKVTIYRKHTYNCQVSPVEATLRGACGPLATSSFCYDLANTHTESLYFTREPAL